ncbi:MAG: phosphocholine cytidylyltransferase family protein [Holosporales bacterium]|jgi:choline kinase|nr:phosphocholine cytidylyltransferase family protein [Holosporales bacterium]
MRGLILAAGRGSRMGGLTEDCPKGLIPLRGKPLIEHQLEALQAAGIQEIGIVTGYRAEAFDKYGMRRFHNARWAETNMVFSLFCAITWLKEADCMVSYGDIFYDSLLVLDLMRSDTLVSIAYDPDWLSLWRLRFTDPLQDAETFRLSPEGMLQEIGAKPSSVEEIQGQYMGLLFFRKAFWLSAPRPCDEKLFMTDFLREVIKETSIGCVSNAYPWGEVDQPTDLEVYEHGQG